jgi:hypothetical protein
MFFKVLAIAAIAATPALAHAQGTAKQTQDTTAMGHTKSHMDSTTMTPKMHSSTKTHDTTAMGHTSPKKTTSMTTHHPMGMKKDSSSMNVSPADSAKMGMTKTPPR